MILKKFMALLTLITLIASLVSCDEFNKKFGTGFGDKDNNENIPNSESQGENENPDQGESEPEDPLVYVYSVTSKVIHKQGCYHIDRMNEEYKKEFTGDIIELLVKEYTLCKSCFPPEKDEEPKEEEPVEDENAVKPEDATFVVNRNSLTVHELDCHHIEAMSEKNIKYTDLTLEELMATEHVPCGACMPDEYKKYKEEHGLDDKK